MSRARTAEAAPRGAGTTPVAPGVAARWVDVLAGERLRIAVDAGEDPAEGAEHIALRERGSGAEATTPLEPTGAADGSRQAVLDLRALAPGPTAVAPGDPAPSEPPRTASRAAWYPDASPLAGTAASPAVGEPRVWDVRLRAGGGDRPLTAARAAIDGPRVVWLDGAALRVRPEVTARGTLAVRMRAAPLHAEVLRVAVGEEGIAVAGRLPAAPGDPTGEPRVLARRRRDGAERTGPATLDGGAFTGRLDLAALAGDPGDPADAWDLHLVAGGRQPPLRLGARLGEVALNAVVRYPPRVVTSDGVRRRLRPAFTAAGYLTIRSRAAPATATESRRARRRPAAGGGGAGPAAQEPPSPATPRMRAARRLARSAYAKAQTAAIALLGRALAAGARERPGRAAADGGRVTIVIAHAYGMGGTIRTALNLAGHLARDREVEIISVVRRRDRPWFGWPPGVRVSALDDQRPSADPGGWRGRLIALLRRCPSVLVHVEDHAFGACSLWTDIGFVRRLRALGPGILVTTRPAFNLMAAHLAPPAVVAVAQEHMHVKSHGPRLLGEMRRRYARLDALAVLTEADRRDYERLFASRGPRLEHIPNAPPRLAGGVADPAARVAIAAGRLTTQKGFDMLIPAWAAVAERHPEWTLRIYGNGPKRRRLRRLIAEHDLFTDVLLMGPSPRLGEAMGGASLYVMSSRFEGFPMVLLEALTKGLPIVSFDCPTGPRDIVEDGRDGILLPPKDTAALSGALLALVEDEERRRRYAAAALQAGARYDIAAVGATWDALFAELVGARRAAAR